MHIISKIINKNPTHITKLTLQNSYKKMYITTYIVEIFWTKSYVGPFTARSQFRGGSAARLVFIYCARLGVYYLRTGVFT